MTFKTAAGGVGWGLELSSTSHLRFEGFQLRGPGRQVRLLADLNGGAVALRVSAERGRGRYRAPDGATLTGRAYVYAPTLAPVVRVRFFLDERPDATPFRTGRAPLDTRRLRNARP